MLYPSPGSPDEWDCQQESMICSPPLPDVFSDYPMREWSGTRELSRENFQTSNLPKPHFAEFARGRLASILPSIRHPIAPIVQDPQALGTVRGQNIPVHEEVEGLQDIIDKINRFEQKMSDWCCADSACDASTWFRPPPLPHTHTHTHTHARTHARTHAHGYLLPPAPEPRSTPAQCDPSNNGPLSTPCDSPFTSSSRPSPFPFFYLAVVRFLCTNIRYNRQCDERGAYDVKNGVRKDYFVYPLSQTCLFIYTILMAATEESHRRGKHRRATRCHRGRCKHQGKPWEV